MRRLLPVLLLACAGLAHAGTACEAQPIKANTFIKGMRLAEQTRQLLDESGAQVALIGRVGQDLSTYGLRYSHMAYAWRDHPKGRWLVRHELNRCGTAESALFDEGLGNFFLDGLFAHEALIVIPGAASQARLAALLATATPQRLHWAHYNMLAYPFSAEYQNSNQWLLEAYAVSAADVSIASRTDAQAWLRLAGYQPTTLDIPAMTRLGARMFRANVAFDDQPFERRMAGHIDTVTVESVARFIRKRDPDARETVVSVR
ncbi:MAG: DUF2145 domain-containing protein [Pseudomonadota bacterium]